MSSAKKCDRCGKLYDFYPMDEHNYRTTPNGLNISQFGKGPENENSTLFSIDLCPKCMHMFIDWVMYPSKEHDVLDSVYKDAYKIIEDGYLKYFPSAGGDTYE